MRRTSLCATVALGCTFLNSCGRTVSGHTYHNNGGAVEVEFLSGGRARISAGIARRTCVYSESGNKVNLVCGGVATILSVQDDGALVGPPDGLMARLTPVQHN
jgi:hypothetical protein